MTSRQRGAAWFLALVLLGRFLDALNLPFEKQLAPAGVHAGVHEDTLRSADVWDVRTIAPKQFTTSPPDTGVAATPIAINEASARELQALPRVGPVLAARIVAWRQEHGPFRSLADLKRVQGIGARTAERLAPLVRFD